MSSDDSIRPFKIDIPEESLQELRRRVAMPRWPDRETVGDRTQGAQLAKVQELVDYWAIALPPKLTCGQIKGFSL